MERINLNHSSVETTDRNTKTVFVERLNNAEVEELAHELVKTFKNPKYFSWYCQTIYEFKPPLIRYWMKKAVEKGKDPSKLFSYFVKQARAKNAKLGVKGPL